MAQNPDVTAHESESHDAVERIENPTREEFERVVSRKSPVIITGLTRDWPALSLWNLD